MKNLDEQLTKQNEKFSRLYEGESVSNTESILDDINPQTQIENGLAILSFVFKNNLAFKKLNFLEIFNYIQKGSILLHLSQSEQKKKKNSEINI